MQVRAEIPADHDQVRELTLAAFESGEEAAIVDRLREQAEPAISLVAVEGDGVVGHVMFSPVGHSGDSAEILMALGPMAVLPARQRAGIGGSLVVAGLERCRALGAVGVIVLGHPTYYPRFGFSPASDFGIRCSVEVPDEVFMALETTPGGLLGLAGEIRYHSAFGI